MSPGNGREEEGGREGRGREGGGREGRGREGGGREEGGREGGGREGGGRKEGGREGGGREEGGKKGGGRKEGGREGGGEDGRGGNCIMNSSRESLSGRTGISYTCPCTNWELFDNFETFVVLFSIGNTSIVSYKWTSLIMASAETAGLLILLSMTTVNDSVAVCLSFAKDKPVCSVDCTSSLSLGSSSIIPRMLLDNGCPRDCCDITSGELIECCNCNFVVVSASFVPSVFVILVSRIFFNLAPNFPTLGFLSSTSEVDTDADNNLGFTCNTTSDILVRVVGGDSLLSSIEKLAVSFDGMLLLAGPSSSCRSDSETKPVMVVAS